MQTQTAVNRNGCTLSSPGAASCPAEKLGPNFIADAAVPVGDPCFLEVAAVVNSRDLSHKNPFFQMEMCFRWPVTTFAQGSGEKTRGRQNRTSRVREIQRSLLNLIFSLGLDGSRQVAVSASKCLFNNHQLPSLDCKQAFAPRTQIYSWNESKARFRQLVGASVAQRRDGACCQMVRRFLQHPSREKRRR